MDTTKQPQTDGQYQGQDADFGVFRPLPDQPGPFPVEYSSWTQFSGIPSATNDHNSFRWETILTPPTTPASPGAEFDPNYFTNFDVMHSLGKNNSTDFEADPRGADSAMLASTPVAKSLLEALNSSGNLIPQPDGPVLASDVFNFNDATEEGYKLYAEALEKLGSSSGSYNLFGSSEAIPSSTNSSSPTKELDGSVSTKPSYSEVAKLLKNNQSSSKDKDSDSDATKKKDNTNKSVKGNKKFIPRPIRGRNNSVPDDMRPTVSPDSKYGLDDFGEITLSKGEKEEKASGLDKIPSIVRKNSTSSLSSGTSGIEEIHLPKSCFNYEPLPSDKINIEKLAETKEKGKSFDNMDGPKGQKPFFDPKKIFQSKDTNKRRGQSKSTANEDYGGPTLLNNGKPSYTGWCSTSVPKKSTHYINNNLRDSLKKTNQDPSNDHKPTSADNVRSQSNTRSEKSSRGRSSTSKTVDASSNTKPNMPLQTTFDQELIDEWLGFLYDKAKLCLHQLWTLILMVILLIFSIFVYLLSGCVHILSWIGKTVWNFLENKVFKRKFFTGKRWMKNVSEVPKKIGLEENITLPSTGDEAMQRLLACKGKDPYSILGLKVTATDDDIKKYYRKQAVLVHPDKNQQPGAEEAFKILGHAFDLIGDGTKRQAYDRQLQEATEAEAAMKEFNDLLTKLQEKIQQASNMMRCDNCGGKHRRVPVDRPWYAARFCDKCSIRHSAKEGDVWAETSMLGFLWHYYACMEGKVFDITEWVSCKREFFKHLQANAHHVFYRIATEGNRGGHHNRSNGGGGGGAGSGGAGSAAGTEGDLEDFISHLFHQAMNQEGSGTSQTWQQTSQSNNQPWGAASATQPAPNTGKRNRKKKKKH